MYLHLISATKPRTSVAKMLPAVEGMAWESWINWAHARVHKITPVFQRGTLRDPFYDKASHTVIWNDDVNVARPWQKLIDLVNETSLVLDVRPTA